MKTAKRIASAVLLLAMLLSVSACSEAKTEGNTDPAEQTDTSVSAEEAVEAEPEVDELADDLPDTDLGGYSFRIYCNLETQIPSVYADSLTGNPVNDAVYDKIAATEERFNCDVTLAESGGGESGITAAVLAGDDSFDIATGHDITLANMTLEGNFMNLYNLPHLDFTKPWWPAQTVDCLTLDGAMYLFSNFISYYNMSDTRVWFFNKGLFTDLGLAYPYESVYEGTWTLDALNELVKDSYIDLNGNGQVDDNDDRFGIVNSSYYCFLEPFGLEAYHHTEDGGLEYVFDVEQYSALIEKFAGLFYGTSGRRIADWQQAEAIFKNGHAMMIYETISYATSMLSQSDIVYGVLPMPKFDETQADYFAGCTDRPYVVPITAAPHLTETGLIIEALSAEGYRKVYPAYFEVALKARYADQTDDAKMMDIIMSNDILSFTYMYGNYSSANSILLGNMFSGSTPNTDVASWAAKQQKVQTKYVERLLKSFQSIKESQEG